SKGDEFAWSFHRSISALVKLGATPRHVNLPTVPAPHLLVHPVPLMAIDVSRRIPVLCSACRVFSAICTHYVSTCFVSLVQSTPFCRIEARNTIPAVSISPRSDSSFKGTCVIGLLTEARLDPC